MSRITFALSKGRLAEETLDLLNKINIKPVSMTDKSRKLIINSSDNKYSFFLSKPGDVPTYVEHGVADIGVVGYDTVLEEDRDLYKCLNLNIGRCKMCVASLPDKKELIQGWNQIKVATKYPNIARKYFVAKNKKIEIIKLNGSVELGAIVGLADCIVDIVESGKTLEENGLEVVEDVCLLSAIVIVNKVSIKIKYAEISGIIRKMEENL